MREYLILAAVGVLLIADLLWPGARMVLFVAAAAGALPLVLRGLVSVGQLRITIDTFNLFALGVSFATVDPRSAAFIVLMITSADLLDWRTTQRSQHAVQRLLALKPATAVRERGEKLETIPTDQVKEGDILVVETGASVPADGIVVSGTAFVNEALVTGESAPVQKTPGARVLVSTIAESGAIKVRATHVGKNSTIERMAQLIRGAAQNKSRSERLADRFAAIFLPVLLLLGAGVWWRTHDLRMTAALFLVACADDMALAIPLAMTAALGSAAKSGVVIKGGAVLDALAKAKTFVLDKTGTLTYGSFRLEQVHIDPAFSEERFWRLTGIASKFSEHPVSRTLLQEAYRHVKHIPDPDDVKVYRGRGISVRYGDDHIAAGSEKLLTELGLPMRPSIHAALERARTGGTAVLVLVNGNLAGTITVADIPRKEAAVSVRRLTAIGVRNIRIFTGDTEEAARRIARALGIRDVSAGMTPEDKLRALEKIASRPVVMVGDGINDAPALARADVGIAMGGAGTAIASEAADAVVLTDNLARLPEMVLLSRRTMSVIRGDIVIWALSNAVGFALVLTGVFGPALAAFYNFATDFFPLINSARLFRQRA